MPKKAAADEVDTHTEESPVDTLTMDANQMVLAALAKVVQRVEQSTADNAAFRADVLERIANIERDKPAKLTAPAPTLNTQGLPAMRKLDDLLLRAGNKSRLEPDGTDSAASEDDAFDASSVTSHGSSVKHTPPRAPGAADPFGAFGSDFFSPVDMSRLARTGTGTASKALQELQARGVEARRNTALESPHEYHKWMLQLFDLAGDKARRKELGASVHRLKALIRRALECYTTGGVTLVNVYIKAIKQEANGYSAFYEADPENPRVIEAILRADLSKKGSNTPTSERKSKKDKKWCDYHKKFGGHDTADCLSKPGADTKDSASAADKP
jgi:hypothetical protein